MLIVVLTCLGFGTLTVAHAAGVPATPPVVPTAPARWGGARLVAPATPPALPAENPSSVYARVGLARQVTHGGARGGGGSSSDAAPLHLAPYTPASPNADGTLDGPSLLGLVAKFAVVLALLFVALRVLRVVLPRLQGSGGGLPSMGAAGGMVLHSESLGDKNRVCLLDLGGRVVLTGVSPTAITLLSTIDDPDEIEAVRARYRARPAARVMPWATGASPTSTPTFAAALKDAVARTALVGPARTGDTAPAIPRMSTASDIAYPPAAARAATVDARAAGNDGDVDARIGGALDRLRQLRYKIEKL